MQSPVELADAGDAKDSCTKRQEIATEYRARLTMFQQILLFY